MGFVVEGFAGVAANFQPRPPRLLGVSPGASFQLDGSLAVPVPTYGNEAIAGATPIASTATTSRECQDARGLAVRAYPLCDRLPKVPHDPPEPPKINQVYSP